jgi:hypothetical protein
VLVSFSPKSLPDRKELLSRISGVYFAELGVRFLWIVMRDVLRNADILADQRIEAIGCMPYRK